MRVKNLADSEHLMLALIILIVLVTNQSKCAKSKYKEDISLSRSNLLTPPSSVP